MFQELIAYLQTGKIRTIKSSFNKISVVTDELEVITSSDAEDAISKTINFLKNKEV